MAKRQLGIRLEVDTIEALDGYAEAHGISRTEAVERAVEALTGGREQSNETVGTTDLRAVCEVLRSSNADLRATVSTLTAQLAIKDEQIATAHELVDQSHRLQMAQVQKALPAARPSLIDRIKEAWRS